MEWRRNCLESRGSEFGEGKTSLPFLLFLFSLSLDRRISIENWIDVTFRFVRIVRVHENRQLTRRHQQFGLHESLTRRAGRVVIVALCPSYEPPRWR